MYHLGTDLDLLFRGTPVQRDFLAVGTNFCQVPSPGWGLSSPVSHHTVTMLSLELELSPGDGDVGWVHLQHDSRVRKTQHTITTSPLSGGERCDGSGEGPPRNPSTQIAISHHPPPPQDTSSAPYPGHWHLVGLYVEVRGPHLIQGSIVQFLQGENT